MTRRAAVRSLAILAGAAQTRASLLAETFSGTPQAPAPDAPPSSPTDYHGYLLHPLVVDGCKGQVVEPRHPLPGRPWVWRTLFWDAYPSVDLALLDAGYHLAYVGVGNTFGCPDAMLHFDAFFPAVVQQFKLAPKVTLEGFSRGGLYAYRWAYKNTDKVACIYGDAPVCDMRSWPGGKGKGEGSPKDWLEAQKDYHFTEQELMDFKGEPIDILAPIAAAKIPIIHVVGDADKTVPEAENTDIVRERYLALGGTFVLIVKLGCGHHPHSLTNPTPVADFIIAHTAGGDAAQKAQAVALKSGAVVKLPASIWNPPPKATSGDLL